MNQRKGFRVDILMHFMALKSFVLGKYFHGLLVTVKFPLKLDDPSHVYPSTTAGQAIFDE